MATVTDTPGDDLDANKVKGTNDWDRLFGLSGNDELAAYDGVDWLEGGPGGDSLDGGLGSDVASYASSAQGIKINLAAGTFTGGDIVGDTFFSIEAFEGSARKDEMRGDDGSNNFMGLGGNDRFWGGADVDSITGGVGKDMIEGGAGGDLMVGSTGADRYIYKAVSDSTPGAGGDYIELDQGDRIDLSAIDAKAGQGGDQAFQVIGTSAFTGEGQIRFSEGAGSTSIEINTSGSSGAEMVITADGLLTINASDFVL